LKNPKSTKIRIILEDPGEDEAQTMGEPIGDVVLDLSQLKESTSWETQWYKISRRSGEAAGELQIKTSLRRKDDENEDEDETGVVQSGPILGTVSVLVSDASGMVKKDLLSKNDPYVKLFFEGQQWKSSVKKDNDKPVWKETCVFNLRNKKSKLVAEIWDYNSSTPDAFLGLATVDLARLTTLKTGSMDEGFSLEKKTKKAKAPGVLHLKIDWKEGDIAADPNANDIIIEKVVGGSGSTQNISQSTTVTSFKLPEPQLSPLFSPETALSGDVESDYLYKLIVIGDSAVGKTNIFGRWLTGKFFEDTTATINIEFAAKAYQVNDKVVKIQIWDTAGQERYRALTRQYYRGAQGAALVYDITNKASFDHITKWLEDLRECSDNPQISLLLIGNKTDLERLREISTQDGLSLAKLEQTNFIEMSAKNGENAIKAMQLILQDIHLVEQAKRQKALLQGGGTGSQIPGASVVISTDTNNQGTTFCSSQPNQPC